MHILGENIANKVRSGLDCVITQVKTRKQDSVLTAVQMELVSLEVELGMKTVIASTWRGVDGFVLDPDQTDFSGKIENLKMTASGKINSHIDSNRVDENRGDITVEL